MPSPHEYVPPGPLDSAPGGGFRHREVRADAFAEVLAGIELGDYDRRMIEWLTDVGDDPTCRALASIMWRCRTADPPDGQHSARVRTELPADSLRALADGIGDQVPEAALGVNAVRNLARYAPAGKRVRMVIEWEIDHKTE